MRSFYGRDAKLWLLSPGASATWPLAELIVDDPRRFVTLRLRAGFMRAIIPDWEAPLESVTAEAYGSSFLTKGVLLRSPNKPPAIFWCTTANQAHALAALRVQS